MCFIFYEMNRKKQIILSKERVKLMKNISVNIEDCEIEDRKHILSMIVEKIGSDQLFQEGTGTRLVFSILDDEMLKKIDEFIDQAKEKTKLNLDSETEDSD